MDISLIVPTGVWGETYTNENKLSTPDKYRIIYNSTEFYFNRGIYEPLDIKEFFRTMDTLQQLVEFSDNEYCNDNFCKCTNVGYSYNPKTLTFYNNKNGLELYNNVIHGFEIIDYRIEIILKQFGQVYQTIDVGYDGMIGKSYSLLYRCYTFNINAETVNVEDITLKNMRDFIESIDFLIDNTNFDKIYDTRTLSLKNGIFSCKGIIIKPYIKNICID